MIRMYLHPGYRALLEELGLGDYPRVTDFSSGELLADEGRRDLTRIQAEGKVFFLKRTRFEKTSSALESYLYGQMAHSKPYREMLQLNYLQQRGFNTAEVIAAGEELRFGVPVAGFILTLAAPGVDLSVSYRSADTAGRNRILADLGGLVGRLHRAGFFLSVRLNDVFAQDSIQGTRTLTLIDREARNPAPRRFTRKRALEGIYTGWRRQVRAGDAIGPSQMRSFVRAYATEINSVWAVRPTTLLRALRKLALK